ncbi:nuclear transport factor 2 family protein [Dactylosporangium aurantiacum]|uniref:Nuclear transport factor 2 family protein n=1 Tax=Dactylosporangium aurantiacum TaxID=35754 RepID=A0A9Q9IHM2_9ACTN|nr:nuclear transport factor 2 family protein [Dactylosporangium aurantiacum]MDG6101390.1 nuclear transport factor 2 family protein [Dactylosporangium aurantiacum]UWZ52755.1 nuclear transport factor 2 family protein [Dactylosporangium aurantiacum]
MPEQDDAIAELRRRVRDLEDRLAIMQILATYGPAVDSGSAGPAAQLWTDDGVYDTYPAVLHGRAAIAAMVDGELHQRLIHAGAAHLQGLPHVEVAGDRAVATAYSQLVLRDDTTDSFRIWRTGANRWQFVRTARGWQVTHRVNRQLDGGAEARDLLSAALDEGHAQEGG